MSLWNSLFGRPGKDRFAALVMKALQECGERRPVTYDAESFQLVLPNRVLALGNAYQEYCLAPRRDRQGVTQRYAALGTMQSIDQSLAEVQGSLLPRVRDRFYWEAFRMQMQLGQGKPVGADALPPQVPINGKLTVELVIDSPESVRSVTNADLQRWNLPLEQALMTARENLWKRSNQEFREVAKGLYVSPWNDSHDASRLYLHDLIWQLKVNGDHVAAVPNCNVLIVTGSDDASGLLAMAKMIEEALKLPRPMTGLPMRLQERTWVPLRLEESHPTYWAMRKLEIMTEADECANQKQLLDAIHKKTGEDIFVARYTAVQKQGSPECVSYCVWSEEVDTLLPHASEVALMQKSGSGLTMAARVGWEHVRSVVGGLMEPQNMYPERYRVRRFPTSDQIGRMKALADAR